jgi:hypothetical protein
MKREKTLFKENILCTRKIVQYFRFAEKSGDKASSELSIEAHFCHCHLTGFFKDTSMQVHSLS